MAENAVNETDDRQSRFVLTISGLAFWSTCTALSITGVMERAGAAAPSGVWAKLSNVYNTAVHTLLSEGPSLFLLPRPEFTQVESVSCGLVANVVFPFAISFLLSPPASSTAVSSVRLGAALFLALPIVSYVIFGYFGETKQCPTAS